MLYKSSFLLPLLTVTILLGSMAQAAGIKAKLIGQSKVIQSKSSEGLSHTHYGFQSGSPWPKFHNNALNTGVSQYGGCDGELRFWKPTLFPLQSSPVLGNDGSIFFTAEDGNLYSLAANGQLNWTFPTGNSNAGAPAVAQDGTVYFGGYDTYLYAINPNGTLKWKFKTGGEILSSPTIGTDGTVYVGSNDGAEYALTSAGDQKWKFPTSQPIVSSALLTANGQVVFGGMTGAVYGLDLNGVMQWSYTTGYGVKSSPTADAQGNIYFGSYDWNFYCLRPDGTLKWFHKMPNYVLSSPAIDANGNVYFGCSDCSFYCLDSSGNIKWSFPTGGVIDDAPAIAADGTIYFGSYDWNVYALNPDGTLQWTYGTFGEITSSPAIGIDGAVYIGSRDGNMYALGRETSKVPVTQFIVPPTIQGGNSAIGVVTLAYAPSWDGDIINLTSNNPALTLPPFVKVPTGATSVQFPISTTPVNSNTKVTLTATSGSKTVTATTVVLYQSVTGLSLSPSSIGGNGQSTATVTIGRVAPAAGYKVNLSSAVPSLVTMPASITIPAGATTATFAIASKQVNQTYTFSIYASDGSSTATASLTVQGDVISGLVLNPASIGGNSSTTGTVSLTSPAPPGGWVVHLSAGIPSLVTVPATVVVPAGASSVDFTVSTKPVSTTYTSGIYAADGITSLTVLLNITSDQISSLALRPTSIAAGASSTATVTLVNPAPPGGWHINVSVGVPSLLTAPSTVTVPAGATTASFVVTSKQISFSASSGVYVTDGVSSKSQILTVTTDSVSSVSMSPNIIGGSGTSTGTVTLASPAPAGGWTVHLSVAVPGAASVPATIVVPEGAITGTFILTGHQANTTYTFNVNASDPGSVASTPITITGDVLTGISVNPSTIGGNGVTTGTVTIANPAPAGGWTVFLSAGVPGAVSMPTSVVVPTGATSVDFQIFGQESAISYTTAIIGNDLITSRSTLLTVVADSIAGVSISPTSIGAGQSATGTVTLTTPAPSGGWVVNLKSGVPSVVQTPAYITVPAGAISTTFVVNSVQTTASLSVGIYASDPGSQQSTTINVVGNSIRGLSLTPSSVVGGTSSQGTITLAAPAPTGGWAVQVTVGVPGVVGVPATVIVPAGASSVDFTLTTKHVSNSVTSGVYITDGATGNSASLTITP